MRVALLLILGLSACDTSERATPTGTATAKGAATRPATATGTTTATATATATGTTTATATAAQLTFPSGPTHDAILSAIRTADPRRFKPVGTSSIVFQVSFDGAIQAAFKPPSRLHPRGHLAEVAAYRIARLLGMENVAPAALRRISGDVMRARLDARFTETWPEIYAWVRWDNDIAAEGAVIYWIPGLTPLGLESERKITEWSRWIAIGGELPEERRALAADLSSMIAFDYVIGNGDRWSGSNASGDPEGTRLYVRDHNLAFPTPMLAASHERLFRRVKRVERFSKRFVDGLTRLDRAALEREVGADAERELLTTGQIREVLERRASLLTRVEALVEAHGREAVLYFP